MDLRQGDDQAQWIIVPVVGTTPGRRYGHIISFCRPYLTVFGGNTGSEPVNDTWCLNVETSPFSWIKISCKSEVPPARVYHAGSQCSTGTAAGMLVIFGGRAADQSALNDTWGLRRHRDGSWDWVRAPYKGGTLSPMARYQHSVLFINSCMVVVGGRTNQVSEVVPFDIYDTETSEWTPMSSLKRFRHACWCADDYIYVYGGFEQDSPNLPTSTIVRCSTSKFVKSKEDPSIPTMGSAIPRPLRGTTPPTLPATAPMKHDNQKQLAPLTTFNEKLIAKPNSEASRRPPVKFIQEEEKVFKLSGQAHVAISTNVEDPNNDFANLVRRVSIDKLHEEAKKMTGASKIPIISIMPNPKDSLYSMFLNHLLKPQVYSTSLPEQTFPFKKEHVLELAREFQFLMQEQKVMPSLRTPVKIFGNIHGNFIDLMRFFDSWKAPTSEALGGDIESFAYVFLGNYVDRGTRSLEVICLLFALKIKYPDQIHLLRGSHEDRGINAVYGFGDECKKRLHEDINEPDSVFQVINNAFSCMPLSVIIENKILCVHGGIGPNISSVEDYMRIPKPIDLSPDNTPAETGILLDSLWSDPAPTDADIGYRKNPIRGIENTVMYGADKVQQFLANNKLEMIIRGHEIVLDGLCTAAHGTLITLTSCTNYCGKYNNSACMLVIAKTFDILPKLLPPMPDLDKFEIWMNDSETLKKKPPTPPRKGNDN